MRWFCKHEQHDLLGPLQLNYVLETLRDILKEEKMTNALIQAEGAKITTLVSAVNGLVALANSLKASNDVLIANGTLSPEDLATVQAASDAADAALATIGAAVAADTLTPVISPAPAPVPAPVPTP
jgi:hypothetical protein